jgi:hypothetical protein
MHAREMRIHTVHTVGGCSTVHGNDEYPLVMRRGA